MMGPKSNTRGIIFAIAIIHASLSFGADPSCTPATSSTTINIPNMTIRHDTPIGGVVGTTVVSPAIDTFSCSKGFTYQEFAIKGYGPAAEKIDGMNIYKLGTDNSGIGYAVYGESIGTCPDFRPVIGDSDVGGPDLRVLCKVNGTFTAQPIKGAIQLKFFKIGNITPGIKNGQHVGSFALRNNQSSWVYPESRVNSSAFTVTTIGCTIEKSQINVNFGEVGTKALSKVGSTASEQDFSIPLNCDASTKIKLTLNAGNAGVFDNINGLLNLAKDGSTPTAQGVKIQILRNGTPVEYGKKIDIGTQQTTGFFTIPLTARYYRSAEPLASGIANSSATYTITYE